MRSIKCLIVSLLLPLISLGWNSSGHNTCGAVAYYYLKMNNRQDVIDRVTTILKEHPWYNAQWQKQLAGVKKDMRDVTLFMLASTFPDDARSNPGLGGGEKPQWHFIDMPFVPGGQKANITPPEIPNAETKLEELFNSIAANRDARQKAIDLCWLFHLIEDVHQPLHTICLYDRNHPSGDRGGNTTYIIFGKSQPVKLHAYWDGLVKGDIAKTPFIAQDLLKKSAYRESSLIELGKNTGPKDWIERESFQIGKQSAYMNGSVNGTEDDPTPVNSSYTGSAQKIAERRVVLAGIRIAKKLIALRL